MKIVSRLKLGVFFGGIKKVIKKKVILKCWKLLVLFVIFVGECRCSGCLYNVFVYIEWDDVEDEEEMFEGVVEWIYEGDSGELDNEEVLDDDCLE